MSSRTMDQVEPANEHAEPTAKSNPGGRRRDGLLTTGDMARLSGSTLRTVRFYEEAGLLEPRQRTEGGHRLFAPCELDKMALVADLRAAGLSLDDIKELLELKQNSSCGAVASAGLAARLDEQLSVITERLKVLERVQRNLAAARQLVDRCGECTESPLFPDRCSECGIMADGIDTAGAVGVLWKLGRDR